MKDPVAPVAPTTGVEEEEVSKAELLRALNARADAVLIDPFRVSPVVAAIAAQIAPPAPHHCDRPHIDEMQTWNPPYEPGNGSSN